MALGISGVRLCNVEYCGRRRTSSGNRILGAYATHFFFIKKKKELDDVDGRGEFPLHQHPPMWLLPPAQGDSKESVMSKTQKQWHLELQQKWQLRSSPVFFLSPPLFFVFGFFYLCVSVPCNSMQPFLGFSFPKRVCEIHRGKWWLCCGTEQSDRATPSLPCFLSLSSPVSQRGMGGWRNFKCQKGERNRNS